jgi:heme/copper-type cytochrome/quinol oxidase subunit 2
MRNNMSRRGAALAVLSILAFPGLRMLSQDGPSEGEIKITAQKYSFTPDVIRVKKNDHVKLAITALDGDHGFKLDAFHINDKLKKGEVTPIEFVADKSGTFPFQCSHFCGRGHGKMKGELIVE